MEGLVSNDLHLIVTLAVTEFDSDVSGITRLPPCTRVTPIPPL